MKTINTYPEDNNDENKPYGPELPTEDDVKVALDKLLSPKSEEDYKRSKESLGDVVSLFVLSSDRKIAKRGYELPSIIEKLERPQLVAEIEYEDSAEYNLNKIAEKKTKSLDLTNEEELLLDAEAKLKEIIGYSPSVLALLTPSEVVSLVKEVEDKLDPSKRADFGGLEDDLIVAARTSTKSGFATRARDDKDGRTGMTYESLEGLAGSANHRIAKFNEYETKEKQELIEDYSVRTDKYEKKIGGKNVKFTECANFIMNTHLSLILASRLENARQTNIESFEKNMEIINEVRSRIEEQVDSGLVENVKIKVSGKMVSAGYIVKKLLSQISARYDNKNDKGKPSNGVMGSVVYRDKGYLVEPVGAIKNQLVLGSVIERINSTLGGETKDAGSIDFTNLE